MDTLKIKEGQGVFYKGCRNAIRNGIVINVSENSIDVALVHPIKLRDKCYDDEGAIKEKHKDNVRLKDCPPPFSVAYQRSENGLYCYADMDNLIHIKESEFESINLGIVDDGAVITEHMMEEIKNHPWQDQLQKQKVMSVKQSTNLLHVDNSMIKRTTHEGLKAVTIGLLDENGREKVGTIFVGDGQVNTDKNTAHLAKPKQKSYVLLDRSRDYTFSMRGKNDADGKPTYMNEKIPAATIIAQNKAYNRNKMEQRAKSLDQSVKMNEAEGQTQMGG